MIKLQYLKRKVKIAEFEGKPIYRFYKLTHKIKGLLKCKKKQ